MSIYCTMRDETRRPRTLGRWMHRGFTLIELMVSVAILLAIMTMIGIVFNMAGKASGTAKEMSAANRGLKATLDQLRSDLEGVDPATCMMAIVGKETAAFETPAHQASDEDQIPDPIADAHRVDTLVLFTKRALSPFVCDHNRLLDNSNAPVRLSDTVKVTYGHADLDRLVNSAGTMQWAGSVRSVDGTAGHADMPASQWILTRRVLHFPQLPGYPAQTLDQPYPHGVSAGNALTLLTDDAFTGADINQIADVHALPMPTLVTSYWPSASFILDIDTSNSGISYLFYKTVDYHYRFDGSFGYLFSAAADQHWWEGGWLTESWSRTDTIGGLQTQTFPASQGVNRNLLPPLVQTWFYSYPSNRTRIDPSPPAGATGQAAIDQMGPYLLPNCSSFKIEFTYDDPRQVLLQTIPPYAPEKQAPIRWQSVPNGHIRVWSGLSVEPNNYGGNDPRDVTDPHRWPRALRITIRAYGSGGSSQGAVEQVFMYCFK